MNIHVNCIIPTFTHKDHKIILGSLEAYFVSSSSAKALSIGKVAGPHSLKSTGEVHSAKTGKRERESQGEECLKG